MPHLVLAWSSARLALLDESLTVCFLVGLTLSIPARIDRVALKRFVKPKLGKENYVEA